MTDKELADKIALWFWGKAIPTDILKLAKQLRKAIRQIRKER